MQEYIDFLSYILRISPECAIARLKGNSVAITGYDVYEDLAEILQAPAGSTREKLYNSHLDELDKEKQNLFPSNVTVPIYIRDYSIPQNRKDPFFEELADSVLKTMNKTFGEKEDTTNTADTQIIHEEDDEFAH